MVDMRSCIKTGCRWPAAATLAYRYTTGEVWLSHLSDEDHPATHDLCPHHADTLRVPRGWTLVDDREPREAVKEPSAAEVVEEAQRRRRRVIRVLQEPEEPAPPPSRARYDALLAELPTPEPASAGEPGPDAVPPTGHRDPTARSVLGTATLTSGAGIDVCVVTADVVSEGRDPEHDAATPADAEPPGHLQPERDEPRPGHGDVHRRRVAHELAPLVVDLTTPPRGLLDPPPRRGPEVPDQASIPPSARLRGAIVVPLPLQLPSHSDGDVNP